MSGENKDIIRRQIEEVWNQGNLAAIEETTSTDFVRHIFSSDEHGLEKLRQAAVNWRSAFPDMHITIENTIAEGEKVLSRWTLRGMHKGEFAGHAPTGKHVTVTTMPLVRFKDGKAVEAWDYWDVLGFLHQLGIVPA